MKLNELSDRQINVKFAKRLGWRLVGEKWWHDDIGDGPPMDYCNLFGRQLTEYLLTALERNHIEASGVNAIADHMASRA